LYGIQNYATGKLWTGEVYQSQNADSLRITLDAGLSRAVSPAFYKGIGMGVDVDLRLPVEWAEGKEVYFQFLFKNLGLAYTNQPIQRTTADTTFHFTGLTFEQLVGNTSKLTAQSAMDSLSVSSYRSGQIILLPGFIQAGKIVDEMHGDRFQGYYGIRIYTLSANVPLVYAGLQYKLAESFRLGVSGSYGGFSMFRAGLYSQYQGKHIAVGVGTEDVYGVSSKKARGESIIVRLRWCI
jgi:hypothetical protein